MGLLGQERSLTSLAIWQQYMNVIDRETYRRTDGQTPADS